MKGEQQMRGKIPQWTYWVSFVAIPLTGLSLAALVLPNRDQLAELLTSDFIDKAPVFLGIGLCLEAVTAVVQIQAVLDARRRDAQPLQAGKRDSQGAIFVFTLVVLAAVIMSACLHWFPDSSGDGNDGPWRTWITVTSDRSMCEDSERIRALEQFQYNLADSPDIADVVSPISLGRQYIELGLPVDGWAEAFSSGRPLLTPVGPSRREQRGGPLNGCRSMRFYLTVLEGAHPRRISGTEVSYTMPKILGEAAKRALPPTWPAGMEVSTLHRDVAYVEIQVRAPDNGSGRGAAPIDVLTDELSLTASVDRLTVESLASLTVEKVDATTKMLVPLKRERTMGRRHTGLTVEDLERSPYARMLTDDGTTFALRADIPTVNALTRDRSDLPMIDSHLARMADNPDVVSVRLYVP